MSEEPTFGLNYVKALQDEITRERTRALEAERERDELRERTRLVNDRIGEAIEQLEYELGEWVGVEPPYNDYPYANEAHALLLSVYTLPVPPEAEND